MTLVREPGSEILAQFVLPTRGTWRNTAIHTIPLDALYDSNNIFVREGKLRNRPAMVPFLGGSLGVALPAFSRHIIGGAMGVTPGRKHVFAASPNRLFVYNDISNQWVAYTLVAGETFADYTTDVVDIAFIQAFGTHATLFANEKYPLKLWTPSTTQVGKVLGTNIPNPRSICIAASRVIALNPPHDVVWSNTLNFTVFDPLAIASRAQTSDTGICVRSLSALSFALYKERSIHPARAQAGLDESTAFAFYEPIIAEGPAGVYAITDVEGSHIYMTKSGRIGLFNGTSYPTWIADGIWFFLQQDINQSFAYLIRAVYDYRLNIVIFFYPKVNQPPDLNGMVIVNLPLNNFEPQAGLRPYSFLGTTNLGVTHAVTKRFDDEIDSAFIFQKPDASNAVSQAYTLDENSSVDNDQLYTCSFQTGLQPMPDARHTQITVETFVERDKNNGTLTIEPVISHSLETPSGTIPDAEQQVINLEESPVNEYIGFDQKARFFGLKYSWRSEDVVRYSGAVVYSSSTLKPRR